MIRIDDFQIDEFNEAEMAAHRVSPDEVFQALGDETRSIRRNGGDGAAQQPYLLIGRTHGGRSLTIPIRAVDERLGLWRPATAFDTDPKYLPKQRS